MPAKKVPSNYYYFLEVKYKDGTSKDWRFKDKSLRRSAETAFKKDNNVDKVKKSEGFG